jgi:transcriptional regulator with XRE-family HTH domain
MTGHELTRRRREGGLTQEAAAKALGVSQPYLSLLENGDRPLTQKVKNKAVRLFNLSPIELPVKANVHRVVNTSDDRLTADLSALGYKGFSHWKPSRPKNPVDVLLSALNAKKRDARLVEALPWLVLTFSDMQWDNLFLTAKAHDLQNRLGFVTNVARRLAELSGDETKAKKLRKFEAKLEHSKLEREDTLCKDTMTNAERKWLSVQRPESAKHWHLLTDLSPEHLRYAR